VKGVCRQLLLYFLCNPRQSFYFIDINLCMPYACFPQILQTNLVISLFWYGTYLCVDFSLSTRHVVHMSQLMTRVITTHGIDNEQNHKTKIKQKLYTVLQDKLVQI
jgi:hypothetical protein